MSILLAQELPPNRDASPGSGDYTPSSPVRGQQPRWRLSAEGATWIGICLVVGLVGWWKSFNAVLLLAYVMTGLLGGQLYTLWRRRQGWQAHMSALPTLFAGERVLGQIVVTNSAHMRADCVAEIQIGPQTFRWYLEAAPPGQQQSISWTAILRQRGRFPIQLHLSESDGFGWFHRRTAIPGGEVIVLPAVGDIDIPKLRRWLDRQLPGAMITRPSQRRITLEPIEVRGIRPYRPGDSLRAIHWRTTARRRRLMVREYDTACGMPVVLTLLPPASPGPKEVTERWEATLSFAATMAYYWPQTAEHTPFVLVIAGASPHILYLPPSGQGIRHILRPLADPTAFTPDPPPPTLLRRIGRCVHLVLTPNTMLPDPSPEELPFVPPGQLLIPLTLEQLPSWYTPPGTLAPAIEG
ncbi:MAG: DUF58 domain-containing protein [Gemmataceae bacterium]|nr:DUF58 domain-containing protein [Gemmataceae bacterium]